MDAAMSDHPAIAAAERLLVDRLMHQAAADLVAWTPVYCPNPFTDGRARDLQALFRSRRERDARIAPIWC